MKKDDLKNPDSVHTFDLKTRFLLEAISEVQMTNRFLDAKAGVLVSVESTLLFVVVATIFDSQQFNAIKETILSMPFWGAACILLYCAVYVFFLVGHIIYTLRVLSPSKNPELFVQTGGYKPKGLFFLDRSHVTGKIQPSMKEYLAQLAGCREEDILIELTFEFMKLSYIRDVKADNTQTSFGVLKYLIAGIMVFGVILVLTY